MSLLREDKNENADDLLGEKEKEEEVIHVRDDEELVILDKTSHFSAVEPMDTEAHFITHKPFFSIPNPAPPPSRSSKATLKTKTMAKPVMPKPTVSMPLGCPCSFPGLEAVMVPQVVISLRSYDIRYQAELNSPPQAKNNTLNSNDGIFPI